MRRFKLAPHQSSEPSAGEFAGVRLVNIEQAEASALSKSMAGSYQFGGIFHPDGSTVNLNNSMGATLRWIHKADRTTMVVAYLGPSGDEARDTVQIRLMKNDDGAVFGVSPLRSNRIELLPGQGFVLATEDGHRSMWLRQNAARDRRMLILAETLRKANRTLQRRLRRPMQRSRDVQYSDVVLSSATAPTLAMAALTVAAPAAAAGGGVGTDLEEAAHAKEAEDIAPMTHKLDQEEAEKAAQVEAERAAQVEAEEAQAQAQCESMLQQLAVECRLLREEFEVNSQPQQWSWTGADQEEKLRKQQEDRKAIMQELDRWRDQEITRILKTPIHSSEAGLQDALQQLRFKEQKLRLKEMQLEQTMVRLKIPGVQMLVSWLDTWQENDATEKTDRQYDQRDGGAASPGCVL